ncbi:hypothetical protein [Burkholderia cenocepacia]|uniref:30S ribosomal protein S6 n=1 Tax=Burkholderia cenocepacia TaxID=95486 RepID=A0A3Q9F3K6_9BURK|nr:hypothetical protein [Burkholderia cenocepacia]AZQ51723.1 hypothetical protein D5R55_12325 [Burkholderia cenocepacia]
MPQYIARVVLCDVTDDHADYEILHTAMKSIKFNREVLWNKVKVHLPPAEYFFNGDTLPDELLEQIKGAAAKTKREFRVVLTEVASLRKFNLEKVVEKPTAK